MDILSASIMLFLIMDPLGNIPLFLSALKNVPEKRRFQIIFRELLIALFAMLLFLFLGPKTLVFLNLKQESISIAGGIILFLIALKMIFPPSHSEQSEASEKEPFIVPLAIPLVAGPSILATLLLLVSKEPDRLKDWFFALFIAWFITTLILLSSSLLNKVLKERGLIAIERLMGMILVAMSVQMFLDGIAEYLNLN